MNPADGEALLAGGRFHEAQAWFARALQQDRASVEARMGLAQALVGMGDLVSATAWLSDACRIAPQNLQALQMLADVLLRQALYAQAGPLYQRLCDTPTMRHGGNLLHLGFCAEQVGDIERAAEVYREALALNPDFMEAHVDLAGVLWRLEDAEGTLAHARRGAELAPDHPYAVRMLGMALLNLNRLDEAEPYLRRALELLPHMAIAELDLSFLLLLAGRFDEGWRRYESRWRDTARVRRPAFFVPHGEWQGLQAHPLAGQDIAVYAEQGLGDVIQFLRYVPMLQAQGAKVHCVIQQELVPLVSESFAGVHCLAPGEDLRVRWHAALLELPGRFGTTLDDLPAEVPYLRAPPQRRTAWAERLAPWAGQFKIGLAWSGSLHQVNNRNRAMPLSVLAQLARMPGVQGFSLQKSDAGAYTDIAPADAGLVDLTREWKDFADSAAMIEQLDLVITVDTAIAHLAGALGKPVWILLAPNADWRWLLDREDSPWYPSARLFRRGFGEPREAQIQRVADALRERLV